MRPHYFLILVHPTRHLYNNLREKNKAEIPHLTFLLHVNIPYYTVTILHYLLQIWFQ